VEGIAHLMNAFHCTCSSYLIRYKCISQFEYVRHGDESMQSIILASSSPRRQELLSLLQIPFRVHSSDIDEHIPHGMEAEEAVVQLAERKAKAVSEQFMEEIVIGSDTVVVCDGKILGKPIDRDDAFSMLRQLSGREHRVLTGVAIVNGDKVKSFYEETKVTFWELTDSDITSYLDSGEPFDKAGSYGIQGFGSLFVKKINGDYFNVVGLPVSRLSRELKHFQE
jgi:septum formation protein